MKFFLFIFFRGVYFDLPYSNSMSIFIGCDRKTSIIQNLFFQIIENIRYGGRVSPEAICDGTCSAHSVLHFVPRCLQSALSRRQKLRFGPEKNINSTLLVTGGNNTLELISNWTAEVVFNFVYLIVKLSIIWKKPVFFRIIVSFRFRPTEIT